MAQTVTIALTVSGTPVDTGIAALVAEEARRIYKQKTVNGSGTVTAVSTADDTTADAFVSVALTTTPASGAIQVDWVEPDIGTPTFYVVKVVNTDTPATVYSVVAGGTETDTVSGLTAAEAHSVTVYAVYVASPNRVFASATATGVEPLA